MTSQSNRRTLRRTLLEVALLVGVIAVAVMVGSLSLAMSMRDAVERDSDAFTVEQRTADQIVAQTYEQQLAAYAKEVGELQLSLARLKRISNHLDTDFEVSSFQAGYGQLAVRAVHSPSLAKDGRVFESNVRNSPIQSTRLK